MPTLVIGSRIVSCNITIGLGDSSRGHPGHAKARLQSRLTLCRRVPPAPVVHGPRLNSSEAAPVKPMRVGPAPSQSCSSSPHWSLSIVGEGASQLALGVCLVALRFLASVHSLRPRCCSDRIVLNRSTRSCISARPLKYRGLSISLSLGVPAVSKGCELWRGHSRWRPFPFVPSMSRRDTDTWTGA